MAGKLVLRSSLDSPSLASRPFPNCFAGLGSGIVLALIKWLWLLGGL